MSRQRTIDTHTHIITEDTIRLLQAAAPSLGISLKTNDADTATLRAGDTVYPDFPTGGFDVARRLRDMDDADVDVQVLSVTPTTYLYKQDAALCAATSVIQNDQLARLIAAHPARFMAIGTLPMQDPKRAADELRRCMTQLRLSGAMIASNVAGTNLDDPNLEPVWATAEETGALMYIHPYHVAAADRLKSYYLGNLIGNPLDTTIAAACLIFGGVMQRHPKLKVCLSHGGGFTPYQAARWEHGWAVRPEAKKHLKEQPRNIVGQFFYDTILHSDRTLRGLIDLAGASRVLLGSDYPYDMAMMDCVRHVRSLALPRADEDLILGGHAETLLAGTA